MSEAGRVDDPARPIQETSMNPLIKSSRLMKNDEKWDSLKSKIYRIYIVEDKTLPSTMDIIQKTHDFKASKRKWKYKMDEWGFEKHIPAKDMQILIAKANKRARDGKATTFIHRDQELPPERLERFKKRKMTQPLETASPSAETPHNITYHTPAAYPEEIMVKPLDELTGHHQLEFKSPENLSNWHSLPHDPPPLALSQASKVAEQTFANADDTLFIQNYGQIAGHDIANFPSFNSIRPITPSQDVRDGTNALSIGSGEDHRANEDEAALTTVSKKPCIKLVPPTLCFKCKAISAEHIGEAITSNTNHLLLPDLFSTDQTRCLQGSVLISEHLSRTPAEATTSDILITLKTLDFDEHWHSAEPFAQYLFVGQCLGFLASGYELQRLPREALLSLDLQWLAYSKVFHEMNTSPQSGTPFELYKGSNLYNRARNLENMGSLEDAESYFCEAGSYCCVLDPESSTVSDFGRSLVLVLLGHTNFLKRRNRPTEAIFHLLTLLFDCTNYSTGAYCSSSFRSEPSTVLNQLLDQFDPEDVEAQDLDLLAQLQGGLKHRSWSNRQWLSLTYLAETLSEQGRFAASNWVFSTVDEHLDGSPIALEYYDFYIAWAAHCERQHRLPGGLLKSRIISSTTENESISDVGTSLLAISDEALLESLDNKCSISQGREGEFDSLSATEAMDFILSRYHR